MYTVHISQCLYKTKRDCLVGGKPSSCYYSTSKNDTHPILWEGKLIEIIMMTVFLDQPLGLVSITEHSGGNFFQTGVGGYLNILLSWMIRSFF